MLPDGFGRREALKVQTTTAGYPEERKERDYGSEKGAYGQSKIKLNHKIKICFLSRSHL